VTITLIRHAPVIADWDTRLSASELAEWIARYDTALIDTIPPEPSVYEIVEKADWIIASSLSRTADSLAVLDVAADERNALFDEAPIPSGKGKWLRLRPMQWLMYYRLLWMAGLLRGDASFSAVRQRAQKAAEYLIDRAQMHGTLVLMGHGGMNHLIGRVLRQKGWELQQKGGVKNWATVRYTKTKP